jgi:hypothetical protein
VTELVEKLFAIDDALRAASVPHAFGGAIALAYCVEEPRGTRDLDVNIFVDAGDAGPVLAQLPDGVRVTANDVAVVERDGQTRLWWDGVPIDVFLNNLPLHEAAAEGVVWVPLEGRRIPVLDCASLVIFKSLFDRPKDWADIHAVSAATLDVIEIASRTLAELVGDDDPAYKRLVEISTANPSSA